ncbi:hypothetical protein EVAR_97143_1 [Eumeta japonica]|uniref:Uncharacterized protein n=1 Tax=Eumeta variegata TaxID=151549 RepID=A0A4C1SL10_EUMVA|nr:hypothetical protein EVAR_97143_1 [Eumeta japonica]
MPHTGAFKIGIKRGLATRRRSLPFGAVEMASRIAPAAVGSLSGGRTWPAAAELSLSRGAAGASARAPRIRRRERLAPTFFLAAMNAAGAFFRYLTVS